MKEFGVGFVSAQACGGSQIRNSQGLWKLFIYNVERKRSGEERKTERINVP